MTVIPLREAARRRHMHRAMAKVSDLPVERAYFTGFEHGRSDVFLPAFLMGGLATVVCVGFWIGVWQALS